MQNKYHGSKICKHSTAHDEKRNYKLPKGSVVPTLTMNYKYLQTWNDNTIHTVHRSTTRCLTSNSRLLEIYYRPKECGINALLTKFLMYGAVLDGKKTGRPTQTEYFLPALIVLSFLTHLFFHQELPSVHETITLFSHFSSKIFWRMHDEKIEESSQRALHNIQGDSFRCVTFENVGTQIILSFCDYSDNFYSIWVVNNWYWHW